MPEARELDIVRLGARGDGIAETAAGPVYVPFALPGERVRPSEDGAPQILAGTSADRQAPLCRHFGTCGGCVAQHMRAPLYAAWKRGIVVEAFRQRGLEPDIAPLAGIPPGSRRRAVLTARRTADGVTLGYHRRKSHDLFDLEECPVLLPAIVGQLSALRALVAAIGKAEARLTVLLTPAGLDVAAESAGARVDAKAVAALARLAAEHHIARITVEGDTVIARGAPALACGGAEIVPPPGAFVQAAASAEQAMARLVAAAAGKAKRVADLFCGIGTFTLPLARSARVLALDSDAPALAALASALRHAQGLKPVETRVRDLFREPLSAKELQGLDAVVFDPPRSGAKAQAEELARSSVPVVVAVSCDPGTLARDARILVDSGYALESVTPIDQFLFSAHVEVVAVLRR